MLWIKDIEPRKEIREVLDAAALLELTEFELFVRAHRVWYGREAPEAQIETYFVGYMFREQVPFWVRSYTRNLIAQARLSPDAPEVRPEPGPVVAHGLLKGGFHLLFLIAWLVAVVLLADNATDLLSVTRECYFPPCY